VVDHFRKNLFVTPSSMWCMAYMQRAMEIVRPEHILFSADFSYQYKLGRQARTFQTESGFSLSDQELIAHGNWTASGTDSVWSAARLQGVVWAIRQVWVWRSFRILQGRLQAIL